MGMKDLPLLSPKPIEQFNAFEFLEYIKSIRRENLSESQSRFVDGVSISNKKKLIIKVNKKEPLTQEELERLCQEFHIEKGILEEALLKRKLPFLDASGSLVLPKPKERKKKKDGSERKPRRKKGDAPNNSGGSSNPSEDQLQQPIDNSELPQESSVCAP